MAPIMIKNPTKNNHLYAQLTINCVVRSYYDPHVLHVLTITNSDNKCIALQTYGN